MRNSRGHAPQPSADRPARARHAAVFRTLFASADEIEEGGVVRFMQRTEGVSRTLHPVIHACMCPPDPDASDTPGVSDEARALSKRLCACVRDECLPHGTAGPVRRVLEECGHPAEVVADALNAAGSVWNATPLGVVATRGDLPCALEIARLMLARGADPHSRRATSVEANAARDAAGTGYVVAPLVYCITWHAAELIELLAGSPLFDAGLARQEIVGRAVPARSRLVPFQAASIQGSASSGDDLDTWERIDFSTWYVGPNAYAWIELFAVCICYWYAYVPLGGAAAGKALDLAAGQIERTETSQSGGGVRA